MSRPSVDPPWWWALAYVAAALALYVNTLGHPFVADDLTHIARNPTIAQRSLTGLQRLWTSPYLVGIRPDGTTLEIAADRNEYRPITTLSLWLNAWPCGLRASCFRIVNVVLHALAAWLVCLFACRWSDARAGLVAGAIVLFHPFATDLVGRMVGRAELLVVVGTAGFLAIQRAAGWAGWTWPRTILATLAAVVALGAKEPGIVLLPLAVLQEWLGRAPASSAAGARPARPAAAIARSARPAAAGAHPVARHAWRGAVALALPFALYGGLRAIAVGTPRFERSYYDLLESPLAQAPFATRLPASLTLAGDYVRMMLVPWPLMALDFPIRFPVWTDAGPWIGLGILTAAFGATVWTVIHRNRFALPLAWWLLSFVVVSHLIVPTWTYREVRLAYPMLAALAPAAGWLVAAYGFRSPLARRVSIGALASLALVASVLIHVRNDDWASDLAIASAEISHDPLRPSSQVKLGDMLVLAGRDDEAERAFVEATRLAPSSYQAWYQLAVFYEHHGRIPDAVRAYERAAAVDPTFPNAFVGLGVLAMNAERLDEAQQYLSRAEQADPDDPATQYNLAVLEEWRGHPDEAVARLRRLTERHPTYRLGVEGLAAMTRGPGARH